MIKIFGYSALLVIGLALTAFGSYALYMSKGLIKGTPVEIMMDGTWGSVTAVGIVLTLAGIYKLA